MQDVKRIALVGIGGHSRYYYDRIKELEPEGELKLVAVTVRPEQQVLYPDMLDKLAAEGIRLYSKYGDMLAGEQGKSDIVALPVAISDHCEMSIEALKSGYHVICEKPVAGTVEECLRMKEVQQESGRLLAIGFQNIYSPLIQRMKGIALSGRLGALKSAKTYVLWQRADAYYNRGWGGKLVFNGKIINDCPLMNATSHYLNNMLYVAGRRPCEAAQPVSIYGENYRVKKIESVDTQFLRVVTDSGVTLTFITSHSTDTRVDPQTEYLFEDGKITWDFSGNAVIYRKADSGGYAEIERFYDGGGSGIFYRMLSDVCRAIDGGAGPAATINNSYQHVLCVDKSLESGPIIDVPAEYIGSTLVTADDDCLKTGDVNRYIKGIKPLVEKMFAEEKSFYEVGCPWAVQSKTILMESCPDGEDQVLVNALKKTACENERDCIYS
jgi:predicted dehydrogenase